MAVKMPTISEVEHLTMIPTSLGGVPRAMEAHATLPAVISTTAITRPTRLQEGDIAVGRPSRNAMAR